MSLLKEIDTRSKYEPFRRFLDELAMLDPDWQDVSVSKIIKEHIDSLQLNEIDYQAHDQMAQARGVSGHEYNPEVARRFTNPRSNMDLEKQPEQGEMIKYKGKIHTIDGVDSDGRETFVQFGPFGNTVNVKELKQVRTKSGKTAWLHVGA